RHPSTVKTAAFRLSSPRFAQACPPLLSAMRLEGSVSVKIQNGSLAAARLPYFLWNSRRSTAPANPEFPHPAPPPVPCPTYPASPYPKPVNRSGSVVLV